MKDPAKRREVLDAARTLVGRHGNAFTISNLCEESGINRSALRRVFPTKTKLLEALAQDAVQKSRPGVTCTKPSRNSDDWFDRRFRVLERAIASLEVRLEKDIQPDRGAEQPPRPPATISASSDLSRTIPLAKERAHHAPALNPSPLSNDVTDRRDAHEAPELSPPSVVSDIKTDNSAISRSSSGIENGLLPSPLEDASRFLSPSGEMRSPGSSELPPIVGSDMASMAGGSASPLAADEDAVKLGGNSLSHRAVEPEVMRAILLNARAQVSRAADIQTEQHLSNTNEQKLATVVASTILAVGLIVGVVTSYLHFYNVSRAPEKRVAAYNSASKAMTPALLIINATGEGAPLQEQPAWIKSLTSKAARGDTNSQSRLALAYLKGDGVAADPAAALGWSQMAAAQGEPSAQFLLATIYAGGIKPNPAMAARWYAEAAYKGNLKAMHNLAIAYLNGMGVSKDFGAALSWLGRAASYGYTDSAFDLAVLYERGEGVPQDLRLALHWYTVAASKGDREAEQRIQLLKQTTNIALDRLNSDRAPH